VCSVRGTRAATDAAGTVMLAALTVVGVRGVEDAAASGALAAAGGRT
jgi:hypothetical protein